MLWLLFLQSSSSSASACYSATLVLLARLDGVVVVVVYTPVQSPAGLLLSQSYCLAAIYMLNQLASVSHSFSTLSLFSFLQLPLLLLLCRALCTIIALFTVSLPHTRFFHLPTLHAYEIGLLHHSLLLLHRDTHTLSFLLKAHSLVLALLP